MKLLVVSRCCLGYRKFHRRWIDALVDDGHRVAWLSEDWGEARVMARNGVEFLPHSFPRRFELLSVAASALEMRRRIRELEPDVLVSESTVAGHISRALTGVMAAESHRHRHLHIQHSWPWHDLTPLRARLTALAIERLVARVPDHTLFINHEDHETALRHELLSAERTSVHAVGIDPDRYKEIPSDDRLRSAAQLLDPRGDGGCRFLFVGRIVPYKGLLDLLFAFREILRDQPNSRLCIVGSAEPHARSQALERAVRAAAAAPPLAGAVTILPWVDDLPALYAASDVFVMPSVFEGLGLVYLEANAMGVPTIGYHVRGVREAIDHDRTGLLVPPGDVNGLERTMRRLAQDPQLRQRLGDGGRDRWHEGYDNASFAQAVLEIVGRLADD